MVTAAKIEAVEELRQSFKDAKIAVFANTSGVTVEEVSGLRSDLRKGEGKIKVIKNTLARIAVVDTPMEGAKEMFSGPVTVAFGFGEDISVPAKAMLEFAKAKDEKMTILGGVVEGSVVGASEMQTLADLPPKPVVQGMLLGLLQAPVRNLLGALTDVGRKPLYLLQAKADKE